MNASFYYSTGSFDSVASASCASSLDFEDILARHSQGPGLLSEPLLLPFVSGSSEEVPPFPAAHRPPVTALVDLGTHLPLFPEGLKRGNELCDAENNSIPLLAGPTPPRLRLMLKEKLCIRQWAENIVDSDAPGHTPWVGIGDVKHAAWIAEGSLFQPDVLRQTLSCLRSSFQNDYRGVERFLNKVHPKRVSTPARTMERRSCILPSTPSFREALVFERHVTLGSNSERKHWSLQVPAATMNPEMVDMMLELQNLNSYFREKGGPETPVQSSDQATSDAQQIPPMLVISNSTSEIPISISSSTNLETETLAARRGRKVPAALTIPANNDSYPNIPTAFLSPSEYRPKADSACSVASPIGLVRMVSNLRAKCASMCNFTDASPSGIEQDIPIEDSHLATTPSTWDDEDEWAFALDLLNSSQDKKASAESKSQGSQDDLTHLQPALKHVSLMRRASDQLIRLDGLESRTRVQRRSSISEPVVTTQANVPAVQDPPPYPPPSSPLPLPPSLISLSTPSAVRGILKNSKNVRFASLPSRNGILPAQMPRNSTSAPASHVPRPSIAKIAPHSPHPRATALLCPASSPLAQGSPRGITKRTTASNRIASAPVSPGMTNAVHLASATARSNGLPSNPRSITPSKGRYSLAASAGALTASKENRARASSSPAASSRRSCAVGENSARHASLKASSTQKSRMPVPLRNILTRFKQSP